MKYNLTEIQTELLHNDNIRLTLFDFDSEVSVELEVPKFLLMQWYEDEFTIINIRGVIHGFIRLDFWYEEYLKGNEKKAWDIWERANIENLTFNTIE